MAHPSEDDAIAQLASGTIAPIQEETRQRLRGELDDSDLLALETGLLKAFIEGMRAGAGETAELVIEQSSPRGGLMSGEALAAGDLMGPAQLDPSLPSLDPWAERYGAS
jgi:hypothetical protein